MRVDIALPYLPRALRRPLDAFAAAIMAAFAGTVSVFLWKLVASSYALGATGHSIIQTPQWLPQAMMAAGYSVLGLAALMSFLRLLLGAEVSPPGQPES